MKILFALLLPIIAFAEMSLEEKVGQLFVAPVAPDLGEKHFADWERLIDECHIGGALLKPSDPKTQVAFLKRLQDRSPTPLLIAADAEWGLGMRMRETISFPRNLTLGAIQDLSLIEEMGRSLARQARQVGIHLNLAPVADVNCNPLNPIIHMRSFGEDPAEVARRCSAIIRGMRSGHLFTCAKHFPGHGDTVTDSHLSLPLLPHRLDRLQKVELVPFQAAIDEGVDCIMSGHLLVPALDECPASLSARCMKELLRSSMGFRGLIITDALNMRALTNSWSVEEIACRAFAAGNDLLLYGDLQENVPSLVNEQIPRAYRALLRAFQDGIFSIQDLDERVGRILELKKRCTSMSPVSTLLDPEALALKTRLYRAALTLVGGEIPSRPFVYVAIGGSGDEWIVKKLKEEGVEAISLPIDAVEIPSIADRIVVGIHRVKKASEGFGLSQPIRNLIEESEITVLFCSPYVMQLFSSKPFLVAYENDPDAQQAAFDALNHRLIPSGRLPIH
jgi:beta-N-acetylhexosaminidase